MLRYMVTFKDGAKRPVEIRDYNQAVPKINEKLRTGEWKDYEVIP